ncbi:MAG: DUF4097 family beta strand repeat protein [Lachnospiraceae bacterium]|nr:DUF4097 family beta strand repeat protein [Lachnospiraceae bacterium]
MKIFTRICLGICLVLVCIGALCMGAGIALGSGIDEVQQMADNGELNIGNWRWSDGIFYVKNSDTDTEDTLRGDLEAAFPQEEIESFDMDIRYGEIRFLESSTDNIEVVIHAPKRNSYVCKNDNGTLKLEDKTRTNKWRIGDNSVNIEVSIPAGKVFDTVKLKTDAGAVDVNYEFQAENIDVVLNAGELIANYFSAEDKFGIEVGAGNLEIDEFYAEKMEVDCGVGNATLSGAVYEKLEADCGVGNITLTILGKENEYDYEVDCGVGEVHINDASYSGLSKEKSIDNDADRKIHLDCGVGQIELKTLEQEEFNYGTEKTI